eukprot:203013_1
MASVQDPLQPVDLTIDGMIQATSAMRSSWTCFESRLDELENLISVRNKNSHALNDVSSLTGNLLERVKLLASDRTVEDFVRLYCELSYLLDPNQAALDGLPGDFTTLMLNSTAKSDIILSESDFLQKQFRKFKELKEKLPLLDKTIVEDLDLVCSRLARLDDSMRNQMCLAEATNKALNKFLDDYNSIVHLSSLKFVYWISTLGEWEKDLDEQIAVIEAAQ